MSAIDEFLGEIRMDLSYWENLPNKTLHERLHGVVFSVLVTIDGEGRGSAFALKPLYESGGEGEDIAGELHSKWSREYE